jgi:hypothetical protein
LAGTAEPAGTPDRRAGAWAVVLAGPLIVAAWLVEAVAWHEQDLGLLLDGEGGRRPPAARAARRPPRRVDPDPGLYL